MSRGAGGRVRLGIIGLGTVAQAVHLPLLSRHRDRFEVAAVCDLSAELAAVVTERIGLGAAERCRTAEELLDGGRVDAVLVLSSGSHGEVAGAALARGVAVFCEKPLAYTLAEADELARLSERTGAPLQLGYMKLYDPAVRRAARELAAANPTLRSVEVTVLHPSGSSQLAHAALAPPSGDIPPAVLSARRDETARLRAEAVGQGAVDNPTHPAAPVGYAPPPGDPAPERVGDTRLRVGGEGDPTRHREDRARARRDPAQGRTAQVPDELGRLYTEVLLGSVVHDLAVVRMLAGDPERVEFADAWPDGNWESVAVEAVCPGGVRFSLRWHHLDRYPGYREEVRVHHDQGSVALTFPSPYLLNAPTVLAVTERDGDGDRVRTHCSTVEAFEEELLAFHRLVTEGTPPAAGIAEGRADIVTCQRIVRRLAAGRGIELAGEAARA
jgi:myo-inositol 2-dehydrogenase / D-chiro-inositol 1-dehydrogenase